MKKKTPENVQVEHSPQFLKRYLTPWGSWLEMIVRARHPSYDAEFVRVRDVYVCERDPKDAGGIDLFLCHTRCPVAKVAMLIEWAESVGMPIHYEPAGNMVEGFSWPDEKKPEALPELSF